MYFCVYFLQVSPPWFLVSSGSCVYARIFGSSYPEVPVRLLVSSHPHILIPSGSCVLVEIHISLHLQTLRLFIHTLYVLVGILASSNPYVQRFMCACLDSCILTFAYTQVPAYLIVSSIITSLWHIPRFVFACLYPFILTSSHPQAHACLSMSLHPLILICSDSYVLACTLVFSHPQALRLWSCMLIDIIASSVLYVFVFSLSHPHIRVFTCIFGCYFWVEGL